MIDRFVRWLGFGPKPEGWEEYRTRESIKLDNLRNLTSRSALRSKSTQRVFFRDPFVEALRTHVDHMIQERRGE